MSFVAWMPACLREMSESDTYGVSNDNRACVKILLTGRYLTPKVCHSDETAAKPVRDAIMLIPITPILSKQPSLKV